jgi:hypothetical protein
LALILHRENKWPEIKNKTLLTFRKHIIEEKDVNRKRKFKINIKFIKEENEIGKKRERERNQNKFKD